ncbi:MAG: hypothetical protein RI968_122 [Pseudomonadota bacterium]
MRSLSQPEAKNEEGSGPQADPRRREGKRAPSGPESRRGEAGPKRTRGEERGSGPIGRILLRGRKSLWRPSIWAQHCCGAQATYPRASGGSPFRARRPSHAYLVLLRVEVAAFHVPAVASGYSSLWPYSSPWVHLSMDLLRTAVSRHPILWSPDLPLLAQRPPSPLPDNIISRFKQMDGRIHWQSTTTPDVSQPIGV